MISMIVRLSLVIVVLIQDRVISSRRLNGVEYQVRRLSFHSRAKSAGNHHMLLRLLLRLLYLGAWSKLIDRLGIGGVTQRRIEVITTITLRIW